METLRVNYEGNNSLIHESESLESRTPLIYLIVENKSLEPRKFLGGIFRKYGMWERKYPPYY